jgi:hypothetical protein
MPSVEESLTGAGPLGSVLADGVDQISQSQSITFSAYTRSVLPADGFIFWILNAQNSFTAEGSFHYATRTEQREDATITVNSVVFTALEEVNQLNTVDAQNIYIGTFQGQQFAFSLRKSYYVQSGLHHYAGDAVYPEMQTQLIDTIGELRALEPVVSNSLPIWLALNRYITLYPSFLLPANIVPPFGSVHVAETTAMQQVAERAPVFKYTPYVYGNYFSCGYILDSLNQPLEIDHTEHYQLTRDKVRITLWGLRNADALGFLDYIIEYMTNHNTMGLLNTPIVVDEKRLQSELNIIGQKKTIEFEVSYHQQAAYQCAAQLIQSAAVTFFTGA